MPKYQKSEPDGQVRCLVCPRTCVLSEGQRGFCNVRQNQAGEVVSTTWGYNTGLAIDPIEKKPLYHFLPGSSVLSFGTLGCNMGCVFCQNWSLSKSRAGNEGLERIEPEAIAAVAVAHGCRSVAYTYNEPTVFLEYAMDTALACRERGIANVAVSAGYMNPESRADFYRLIDAVNIDLKGFTEDFYHRNCFASLAPVLDTIRYVKNETPVWLELTTLLIEGENDADDDLRRQCDWIVENLGTTTPLHFSAFHPAWKMQNKPVTSLNTLIRARAIAMESGILHVYTGNVVYPEGSETHCEHCGKVLISRDRFQTRVGNLLHGHCGFCALPLSGFFD